MTGCRDCAVVKFESVVGTRTLSLVGKARLGQRAKQPLAATIAGKHAARPVGAMHGPHDPTITMRAAGSPKLGTGRPQYCQSR